MRRMQKSLKLLILYQMTCRLLIQVSCNIIFFVKLQVLLTNEPPNNTGRFSFFKVLYIFYNLVPCSFYGGESNPSGVGC